MEDTGDEKMKFLEQLKKYNSFLILCNMDSLLLSPSYLKLKRRDKEFYYNLVRRHTEMAASGDPPLLEGIDLDGLRHFNYDHLKDADRFDKESVLGNTLFGRFVVGSINQDSIVKTVTMKTWDLEFPIRRDLSYHSDRLHNEITLLTKELESHPNLPKLIGYSIDKRMAVVYDLKAKQTLKCALQSGDLGWDSRLKYATQVANLLEHFRCSGITIGSLDPTNILIDEDDNLKLCEFGLVNRVPEMLEIGGHGHLYAAGIYSCYAPETRDPNGKWTPKTDILAFGHLLVDLVTKEAFDDPYKFHACFLSKFHATLLSDEDSRSELTRLIVSCLEDKPEHRPESQTIVDVLKKLAVEDKPQVSGRNKRKWDSH